MTVNEKLIKLQNDLTNILNDCNIAITTKGGSTSNNLQGLSNKIIAIPSGSTETRIREFTTNLQQPSDIVLWSVNAEKKVN